MGHIDDVVAASPVPEIEIVAAGELHEGDWLLDRGLPTFVHAVDRVEGRIEITTEVAGAEAFPACVWRHYAEATEPRIIRRRHGPAWPT